MTFVPRLLAIVGTLLFATLVLALGLVSGANAAYSDPPGRVARISDSGGDISFSPAGENKWLYSVRNRPLIRGDRLWSSRGAHAEIQVGSAAIRMDQNTSLEVLELSDQLVQLRMTRGTLNVRVRRLYRGQTLEIATPTLAFVVDRVGNYRIDVDARRDVTTVVVWNGNAQAYGTNARFPLRAGDTVRFYSADLRDYQSYGLPRKDDFDRYCTLRDVGFERSASLRYVDDDLIGYNDLDQYGSWSASRDYGNIWFPTQVRRNWAPYRDGHWVWQEPWGWTWVDDALWGFAPSHYGRWVFVSNRWGWIPGPRNTRSIYAPALVAFVGGRAWSASVRFGGGSRIGWFPLGPREAYLPSYRASRAYFTQINVSNTVINNTTITNIYNNYANGRIDVAQSNYSNRSVAGALTAVPNDVFVNAKPVREAQLQLDASASRGGEIMQLVAVAPSEQSILGIAPIANAKPDQATFSREVIALNKPAPDVAAFSARQQQLQRNPGVAIAPPANGNRAVEPINVRVIAPTAAAVDARELGARRVNEQPDAAAGKPAQLKPLDRSVDVEATVVPEAGARQRDEQARQQEIQRKEAEREQAVNAQKQRDEQTREQETQRQEVVRQQAVNAQKQRDEQTRQQETQRQEVVRQQAVEAQNRRDEQARQQETQRQEVERQQAVEAQKQRDEQARQQEAQRQEVERQQTVEAQNKRDEQANQKQQESSQDQAVPDEASPAKPNRRKRGDKGDDVDR